MIQVLFCKTLGDLECSGLAFQKRSGAVVRALRKLFWGLLLAFGSYGLRNLLLVPFLSFIEFQQRYFLCRSYMHEYGIRYCECIHAYKYKMMTHDECIRISILNSMVLK